MRTISQTSRLADTNLLLFLLMSLIWGATWIAIKAGLAAVPPVFFAATRYALVALILTIFVHDLKAFADRRLIGRILVSGLLVNTGTYALLFWGMQFVESGMSGLVNLSLVPVGLFILSVLFKDEKATWRHGLALALGAAGLAALFSSKISTTSTHELWGVLAIVAGTFCYCLGTVLSRPLLLRMSPLQLTTWQAIVGSVGLLAIALSLEPISIQTITALMSPTPLAALLYLVVLGTIVAYAIYLRLVRDWGATQAGLYPFISPLVALALGWLVYAEEIGIAQVIGALLMLGAAALAIIEPKKSSIASAQHRHP